MPGTDATQAVRFLSLLAAVVHVFAQDSPIKICLNEEEKGQSVNVTLKCPSGTVISVTQAFFGTNQWGLCSYTQGDCIENVPAFQQCNGVDVCNRVFAGTYTLRCRFPTFMTVMYDCVVGTGHPTTATTGLSSEVNKRRTTTLAIPRHVLRVSNRDPLVTPNKDNTAIIAGCVVAVVITVFVLIFAIILVVRRLLCIPQDGHGRGPKKMNRIVHLLCSKLGCTFSSCQSTDLEEGSSERGGTGQGQDDGGRLTPDGAAAIENVQELGRDVGDSDQTPPGGAVHPVSRSSSPSSGRTEIQAEIETRHLPVPSGSHSSNQQNSPRLSNSHSPRLGASHAQRDNHPDLSSSVQTDCRSSSPSNPPSSRPRNSCPSNNRQSHTNPDSHDRLSVGDNRSRSVSPANSGQHNTSQSRMTAVAIPNTELSTLC